MFKDCEAVNKKSYDDVQSLITDSVKENEANSEKKDDVN